MIKKGLYLLLLLGNIALAQKNGEATGADYFFLERTETIQYVKDTYPFLWDSEILAEKKEINGKAYFIEHNIYQDESEDSIHYRVDNGAVYVYSAEVKKEWQRAPARPKKGDRWNGPNDLGTYEIISMNASFESSTQKYKGLMKIALYKDDTVYYMYYKKGFGLVGKSQSNEKRKSYVLPKDRELSYTMATDASCKNESTDELKLNCMGQKLGQYVLKKETKSPDSVSGSYVFHCVVGRDGMIVQSECIKFPEGGEERAKNLVELIKTYKKIKPSMIDDYLPVELPFTLPLNFK